MKDIKKWIWIGLATMIAICILYGIIVWNIVPEDKQGVFGDMYGAVNALFSGFALLGVVIAIVYQQQELKLQREELSETRKEFAQQTKRISCSVLKLLILTY